MTIFKGSRYADEETNFVIVDENNSRHLSRVLPFEVDTEPSDGVYVTQNGDTYWSIAGQRSVYNDPNMYDVIASANPSPDFFKNMFDGFEAGVRLRIPPVEKVFKRRGGRPSKNSLR